MARTVNATPNAEDVKMAKYIVEAPEPKKGQKASSGGIRENGRIASQFKNPIPYKDKAPSRVPAQNSFGTALTCKEQEENRNNTIGCYLLNLVWQEFGEPILRSGFRMLGNIVVSKIESSAKQAIQGVSLSEPEIIDIEADEVKTIDNNKTIRFPNNKAI